MKTRLLFPALLIVVSTVVAPLTALAGGERTNIRGMGMARTFVASSVGLDAVGINPANLVAPEAGTVTIGLMPVGVHLGSDFLNYGLYQDYFTGVETGDGREPRYLTDADKQSILASFPNGVGRASAHAELRLFGVGVRLGDLGSFAVTITDYVSANAMVPRDYPEFLLYGNTPGSVYDFSETSGYATWLREYAVSYGRALPCPAFLQTLSGGIAVKLIHGFGYFGIDRFATRLATSPEGVLSGMVDMHGQISGIEPLVGGSGSFSPFAAPAGTGFGLDLGVASDVNDYLRVGLSVTDIGSVRWTGNTEEVSSHAVLYMDDPLNEAQRDSIENSVNGDTRPGPSFSTNLPTTLRVGASVELHKVKALQRLLWGEWTVACDINLGLVEAAGSPTAGRFSMGLEFRPWSFLPLRTGASFWGADHFKLAFGIGFHFGVYELDLASEHMNFLFSEKSLSHGSIAMGMRVRI